MSYKVGQKLEGGVVRLRQTETTPPKRFTEGTLIMAMTNIHRFVTSEADRQVLREAKGIGTERTRDAIIKILLQRGYLKVIKRELHPTDLGIELIDKLPRELSDPVTTAKWEMALGLIEQGKMPPEKFKELIKGMTRKLVAVMQEVKFDLTKIGGKPATEKQSIEQDASLPGHGETCEKCKKGTMTGKKLASGKRVVSCSNYPSCKHSKWIND